LIEHGASVGPRSPTLLYLAASYKLSAAVTAMLRHGADPNGEGPKGFTPAHGAVLYPGAYTSHDLIIPGPTLEDYGAIFPEAVDVLGTLLAHGADPNATSDDGKTPLKSINQRYWWDRRDHPEIRSEFRRLLIEAGARPGDGGAESGPPPN
jgi:ankyrin repeat protein